MLVIESLTFTSATERRTVLEGVLGALETGGLTLGAGITSVQAPTSELRFEIVFNKAIDGEMVRRAVQGLPIPMRKFHIMTR